MSISEKKLHQETVKKILNSLHLFFSFMENDKVLCFFFFGLHFRSAKELEFLSSLVLNL